jgi:hypothetical protein
MEVERTHDWQLIKEIATHPRTWPSISDDSAPRPEDWEPNRDEHVYYLLARQYDSVVAMLVVWPDNFVCWQAHLCVMPSAYGPIGVAAVKRIIQWIWDNTTCVRLVASIAEYKTLAISFSLKCGLTGFGMNPNSYKKNGELHNMILLGISKE